MEKYLDPQFWKSLLAAVWNEPVLLPVIVLVGLGTWWIAKGRYRGTIDGLREQVAALNERLHLAQDSERTIERKSTLLETQVESLRAQIAAGASTEKLMGFTGPISLTASEIKVANTEIGRALMTVQPGPTGPAGPSRKP
jgi:hypothetical protein